jgi:hypothetical protein
VSRSIWKLLWSLLRACGFLWLARVLIVFVRLPMARPCPQYSSKIVSVFVCVPVLVLELYWCASPQDGVTGERQKKLLKLMRAELGLTGKASSRVPFTSQLSEIQLQAVNSREKSLLDIRWKTLVASRLHYLRVLPAPCAVLLPPPTNR